MYISDTCLLLISAAIVTTLGFALYVQFSPSMGGIWLRYDSTGIKVFTPSSLFRLMAEPFRLHNSVGRNFWTRTALWPINWPLWMAASTSAVLALSHIR